MVLDDSLLNTQHFKIWIKDKWSNLRKEVAPSNTSSTAVDQLTSINIKKKKQAMAHSGAQTHNSSEFFFEMNLLIMML